MPKNYTSGFVFVYLILAAMCFGHLMDAKIAEKRHTEVLKEIQTRCTK